MNESKWEILGIEPTKDKKQIKKAYARALKSCHPEEYPEAFKILHSAYEQALKYADRQETIHSFESGIVPKEAFTVNHAPSKKEGINSPQNDVIQQSKKETTTKPKPLEEQKSFFQREKIGGYFADREKKKAADSAIFYHKVKWFQSHWHIEQAQKEMEEYLSTDRFAQIKEEPEVVQFLYYSLRDRGNFFGDPIKKVLWRQYEFLTKRMYGLEGSYLGLYKILLQDHKRKTFEEENRQIRLLVEENERLSAIKRKQFFKKLFVLMTIVLVLVLTGFLGNTIVRFRTQKQIQEEHMMHSDKIIELLTEKYPNMEFDAVQVLKSNNRMQYQVIVSAKASSLGSYSVQIEVYVGENQSIEISDNLATQLLDQMMEQYDIKLALGSTTKYFDEEDADAILVAYYTPNEHNNMEHVRDFLTDPVFQEQFQWVDRVVFCYDEAKYPQYFFKGGEGGIPQVLSYTTSQLPDKQQLVNEMYYQGLSYYIHYVPWQAKPEFLEGGYMEEYYAQAAEFLDEQEQILASAKQLFDDRTASQARELVEFAQSYGETVLLFQSGEQLCITNGDLYRLLLKAGADVERNSQRNGFSLTLKNGRIVLWEEQGMMEHTINCEDALMYLKAAI